MGNLFPDVSDEAVSDVVKSCGDYKSSTFLSGWFVCFLFRDFATLSSSPHSMQTFVGVHDAS